MTLKRITSICLVLLLSCSFCFSAGMFGDKKRSEALEDFTQVSQSESPKTSLSDSLATSINSVKNLKGSNDSSEIKGIMEQLNAVKADVEAQSKDNVLKAKQIENLKKENQKLTDAAKITRAGNRMYVRGDAEVGFNNNKANFGVGGTVGVKTTHGIMLEGGVMYDVFGEKAGGLNDLSMHVGAGYMF